MTNHELTLKGVDDMTQLSENNKLYDHYLEELKAMFLYHRGKYTQRLFEPQWVLLPFYWFMKDFKKQNKNISQFDVKAFVNKSVNSLSETDNIHVCEVEVSNLEKGYMNIIENNPLFKTVLEMEEDMFFEVYEKLNKMKNKEQKIEDVKLQVLNLYTSSKNKLNTNVLNVASYLSSLQKGTKLHKG